MQKSILVAATLGLLAGNTVIETDAQARKKKNQSVKCWGVNSCKGQGKCAVEQGQIDAANGAFNNKFAKAFVHECAGFNQCGADQGHLEWVNLPSKTECIKKGGFLIKKASDQAGKVQNNSGSAKFEVIKQ